MEQLIINLNTPLPFDELAIVLGEELRRVTAITILTGLVLCV
jgi:hypothetical protein